MGLPSKLVDGVRRQPIVGLVLGALVVLLAVLALRLGGAGKGGDAAVDEAAEEAVQAETPQVDASDEGDASADGEAAAAKEDVVVYTTTGEAALRYIDNRGEVRSFSDEPLKLGTELVLNLGASVSVSAQDERQLADSYLKDLWADLQAHRDGATSFSSELSQMLDPDQYAAFLGELAACDESYLSRVVHLAVDEGELEPEGEGEGVSEPEEDAGSDEEMLEQFGSKPSAGAMK